MKYKKLFNQKWSNGEQNEKVNNMVLFNNGNYEKLLSEAPKYKLITPSIHSDRLRVARSIDTPHGHLSTKEEKTIDAIHITSGHALDKAKGFEVAEFEAACEDWRQYISYWTKLPSLEIPCDLMWAEQSISSPPATNLSALENHPFLIVNGHKKKKSDAVEIVISVGGVSVVAAFGALLVIFHRQRAHRKTLEAWVAVRSR